MKGTQQSEFIIFHNAQQPYIEKVPKQIVKCSHLSAMVLSYNLHFATYNMSKKQVSWLILAIKPRNFH
jgi:hypothetical protein